MALPKFKQPSRNFDWLVANKDYGGNDCLIWPFGKNWNGYGHLKASGRPGAYAHRVMCELAHGEPPSDRHQAAHSCGRGHDGCVSPRHLSWKTPAENMHDRRQHGTNKRRANWTNKGNLTDEQIAQIKALKGQKNQREIAAMFGISYQHVSVIQRGKLRRTFAVSSFIT